MSLQQNLKNTELLSVWAEKEQQPYCGGNQEWYGTKRRRLSGCGPTAAANLLYYQHNQTAKPLQRWRSQTQMLQLMNQVWRYVTPGLQGVPSTASFIKKLARYYTVQKQAVQFQVLNVPPEAGKRPTLQKIAYFLYQGLTADAPIAFLSLCKGQAEPLDTWHWVTILSLEYTEDTGLLQITLSDGGQLLAADLALWLATTTKGGGFVYVLPAPHTATNR